MATPQLSPGVLIREVDLTVGRADNVLDNIGAIAGPFPIGPVEEPIDIFTENDLINVFGKPLNTDAQYEYWMSASSYLSYGGVLKVVRVNNAELANANALTVGTGSTADLLIKNFDDYELNVSDDDPEYIFAAKNPGTWANGLVVAFIDDKADQILKINDPGVTSSAIGDAISVSVSNIKVSAGSTSVFTGEVKGIITGVRTDAAASYLDVKITHLVDPGTTQYNTILSPTASSTAGAGATTIYLSSTTGVQTGDLFTSGSNNRINIVGVASTAITLGTGIGSTITSGASATVERTSVVGYSETSIEYGQKSRLASFKAADTITVAGITTTVSTANDWYNEQYIQLVNGGRVYWNSIAPKPVTTQYALQSNGKNDAINIAVFDDLGTVTGIKGNLLEKHVGLSKASDAISSTNSPQKIWWKAYLAQYSKYLYGGDNPSGNESLVVATGFETGTDTALDLTDEQWNAPAQGRTFTALGSKLYTLGGGNDYGADGSMSVEVGDVINGYALFSNRDEIQVDYLIQGPSGGNDIYEAQAKASYLISVANQRKDCIAVISPHRSGVVDITNPDTQTDNIIEFFSGVNGSLPSSSYAVFDSGYKYTYDRFNNKFRYIPCNPDVAGLMVRTSIVAYPWFSPAGQQRGILNNAIKLAYNPNKAQRDQLYPLRVNAIVNQPGIGVLLFGDKTALGYASAFDRINVRRLFLTVEQALEKTAQAQLFELNDELTRANFVNIVEPYLRDIQAKRGVYDFLVVCDASNNTPEVIDNNEFRADIYLKPTKSINYVTLTFIATRTGVSFEEVAGRV
jgi:hypothetical protein